MKINVSGVQADVDGFLTMAQAGLAGPPRQAIEKARVLFAHNMTVLGWFEATDEHEQAQLDETKRIARELLDWANAEARRNGL